MKFSIQHRTDYIYSYPAYDSHNEVRLRPRETAFQQVLSHRLTVDPQVRVREYTDFYGNAVASFSVPYQHHSLSIVAETEVETVAPLRPRLPSGPLALKVLLDPSFQNQWADFLSPTHYVPLNGHVGQVARQLLHDAGNDLTAFIEELLGFMHREFVYQAGVTDVKDNVEVIFEGKRGVCQDYAHVVCGVARAAGIPARYVSGYLQEYEYQQVESHAWAELYVPGRGWWGVDATGSGPITDRYVMLGWGRDYHDVAPVRGLFRGGGKQTLKVEVTIQEMQSQP
ncbi:MAG: transglutaminase family protein [Chloroflexi bacterium]|nr:transglutaminase family protein [Chloroflexota bacterium]